MKISLNEVIDPQAATILVQTGEVDWGHNGAHPPRQARFDLVGFPRIENLLVGKNAAEAVKMSERLCGICPATHHLAGTLALEMATQSAPPPPLAQKVRQVLHLGATIDTHSLRFAALDRAATVTLRRLAKTATAAALSPRHFPTTATIGGISALPQPADFTQLSQDLPAALEAAQKLVQTLAKNATTHTPLIDHFAGANLALTDAHGRPDLLGQHWVATGAAGTLHGSAQDWPEQIIEEHPGQTVPRPYLAQWGPEKGRYRVGPVAQLRIGQLTTPLAAKAQKQWLQRSHGDKNGQNPVVDVAAARAIITLHCLEKLATLSTEILQLLGQQAALDSGGQVSLGNINGNGTGLVDGPRGVLVHTYQLRAGQVQNATILTPTVQNEPWLAQLLTAALGQPADRRQEAFEDSIRTADPCLPVASAPAGQMGLEVLTVNAPQKQVR